MISTGLAREDGQHIAWRTDTLAAFHAAVYLAAALPWWLTGQLAVDQALPFGIMLGGLLVLRQLALRTADPRVVAARGLFAGLAVGPLTYLAQARIVQMHRGRYVDGLLGAVDSALGLHDGFPAWVLGGPLEELSSAVYLSYYALPIAALWIGYRHGADAVSRLALATVGTSALCGVLWILVPAGGYHPGGGPSGPAWGPATEITRAIYQDSPHFAAAFPSQHVAHTAAVCAALWTLGGRSRRWAWVWVWVIAMWWSTVQGQFHFLVDGLAGAGVGVLCASAAFSVAPRIRGRPQLRLVRQGEPVPARIVASSRGPAMDDRRLHDRPGLRLR